MTRLAHGAIVGPGSNSARFPIGGLAMQKLKFLAYTAAAAALTLLAACAHSPY